MFQQTLEEETQQQVFLTSLRVRASQINTVISSNQATDKLTTPHSWNKHRESFAIQSERKSKLREYASWKNTNKRSDGSDTVKKKKKAMETGRES